MGPHLVFSESLVVAGERPLDESQSCSFMICKTWPCECHAHRYMDFMIDRSMTGSLKVVFKVQLTRLLVDVFHRFHRWLAAITCRHHLPPSLATRRASGQTEKINLWFIAVAVVSGGCVDFICSWLYQFFPSVHGGIDRVDHCFFWSWQLQKQVILI